jgi:hypothetical protein
MATLALAEIAARRAANQLLDDGPPRRPEDTVRWMLAMQAQDFAGSLWAVAARDRADETRADIERALTDGRLVRSWPMRGTLHLTAAEDLRPLLTVSAPRSLAASRGRRAQLGLTEEDLARGRELTEQLLAGGNALPRAELMAAITERGLDTSGQRAAHLLLFLSLTGVTCLGPMRGRQHAVVLLDEWLPGVAPERAEALRELTVRYVCGHGPVTAADLAWWAGIPKTEAAASLAAATDALEEVETEQGPMWLAPDSPGADPLRVGEAAATVRLLPPFDELLLGYTDRAGALEPGFAEQVAPGANGLFRPIITRGGRVLGTWRVERSRPPRVELDPFDPAAFLASIAGAEPALEAESASHLRFAAAR